MSSAITAGIFGLGGVALGGAMTMVSTWWQTVNARKGRLAELETQLRHERLLRDEAARPTAMLKFGLHTNTTKQLASK
jgi:citrate synthase